MALYTRGRLCSLAAPLCPDVWPPFSRKGNRKGKAYKKGRVYPVRPFIGREGRIP